MRSHAGVWERDEIPPQPFPAHSSARLSWLFLLLPLVYQSLLDMLLPLPPPIQVFRKLKNKQGVYQLVRSIKRASYHFLYSPI